MLSLIESSFIVKQNIRELRLFVRFNTMFACFFWFSIFSFQAYAAPNVIVELHSETQVISLGKEMKFLTGYSFEQASEVIQLTDEKWALSTKPLNFGYSHNKVWLKFYSRIESNSQFPLVLEFKFPNFDIVKVGFRKVDGSVQFSDVKKEIPLLGMRLPYVNFVATLPFNSGNVTEHLVYLENDGPLPVPIEMKSTRELLKSAFKHLAFYVLTIGSMIIMILYNFFIYLSTREKNYLLYILYISSVVLTCVWLNGLYYFVNHIVFVSDIFESLPLICVITSCLFAKKFLETRKHITRFPAAV